MTEKEIEQLRAELAQACNKLTDTKIEADVWFDKLMQAREELVQAQTEIARVNKISDGYATGWADACAARDALAKERDDLEKSRQFFIDMAEGRDKNLAQARAELKDLQVANRVCEKRLEHQTHTHNFWFKTCLAAEAERDEARKEAQEQSDDVQEHWLNPAEAEGLRRQLKHAEDAHTYRFKEYDALEIDLCHAAAGEAAIVKAAKALLEQSFIEVGQDIRQAADVGNAKIELRRAIWYKSEAAAKLLERLATLDAAEASLSDYNLNSIYDAFDSLPDAIRQMAEHISELESKPIEVEITDSEIAEALQVEMRKRREVEQECAWWCGEAQDGEERHTQTRVKLARVEKQLQEAELAAHVHDKACGELAQTVRTEQALRQEAEKRIKEDDDYLRWLHQILSEGGYIFSANEDGIPVLSLNPMQKLKREKAEAEQRAERAEACLPGHGQALAALVTPELERLLEKLASHTQELAGAKIDIYAEPLEFRIRHWLSDARVARELAAQIREALDDSQA